MANAKKMTELEIAGKIRLRKRFNVPGKRERNMAYACAKYLGVEIITRSDGDEGFDVFFLNGGAE